MKVARTALVAGLALQSAPAASGAAAEVGGNAVLALQEGAVGGRVDIPVAWGNANQADLPEAEADALEWDLRWQDGNPLGCGAFAPVADQTALVVERGNCTYLEKALNAQAAGASALVVVASEAALFNETTGRMINPCALDCSRAESTDAATCATACEPSKPIVGWPENSPPKERRCLSTMLEPAAGASFCCLMNNLVYMSLGDKAEEVSIPTLFVGFYAGPELLARVREGGGARALAFTTPARPPPDWSMLIILLIGTFVTAGASYRAARSERLKASWLWNEPTLVEHDRPQRRVAAAHDDKDGEIDQVTLGVGAVAVFIVMCSAALIGLFYLARSYPQETVIAVQVLFGLSAVFAVSHFFVQPAVRAAWSASSQRAIVVRGSRLGSADELVGVAVSLTLVVVWFVMRHQPWAWLLLDTMGAAVCCMFLVSIRLPNLKLACLMMALFFVYDIFMVFISPAIFNGRSVMVDVARAGAGTATPSETSEVCERTQTERMPMLFLVPRLSEPGSYSLLGLGDVFIPGLLVTYACRFDYLKAEVRGRPAQGWWSMHRYFVALCVAYFAALAFTLAANYFDLNFSTNVQGQPALLYLVPATLGTFVGLAACRGDLRDLWHLSYDELVHRMLEQGEDEEEGGDSEEGAAATSGGASADSASEGSTSAAVAPGAHVKAL